MCHDTLNWKVQEHALKSVSLHYGISQFEGVLRLHQNPHVQNVNLSKHIMLSLITQTLEFVSVL
jgi:hypothetical protein